MRTSSIPLLLFLTIIPSWSLAQCLVSNGGIVLSTQAEIDNFHQDHPNCDSIPGSLQLTGSFSEPTDLNGLLGIEYIQGDLTLNGVSGLSSLHGLDSLKSVGGNLSIWFSPLLNNLEGLGNLELVNGNFEIVENSSSGSGGSAGMEDLSGIHSLDTVRGDLVIHWNQLDSYHGLESLEYIGGLIIGNNNNTGQAPYDTTLNGLHDLGDYLHGSLMITGSNLELISLAGLDTLNEIDGDLVLSSMAIDDFSILDSLEHLSGQFTFDQMINATSLPGFIQNLHHIDSLVISSNPLLTDLNGLDALDSISGILRVSSNETLNDISSLNDLDMTSVNELRLINNPLLSVCSSTCAYLSDSLNTSLIFGNAEGCNSAEEILQSCIVSDLPSIAAQEELSLFPNPVDSKGSISFSRKIGSVSIYTPDMRTLLHSEELNADEMSLPDLSSGLYLIRIGHTVTRSFIVK